MATIAKGAATGPGESPWVLSSSRANSAVQANRYVTLAKLQAVADLVNKLSDDLENISLLPKGTLQPCRRHWWSRSLTFLPKTAMMP